MVAGGAGVWSCGRRLVGVPHMPQLQRTCWGGVHQLHTPRILPFVLEFL